MIGDSERYKGSLLAAGTPALGIVGWPMVTGGTAEVLRGRRTECGVLERLLEAVRGGQSRVLVVGGEAGVGKTALLESAILTASEFRVLRCGGVESEMELAFAALQLLCAPLLDRLERLPAPQQDALAVAFGLRAGNPPDRFLVGLAVLSLFSEAAEEQPLEPVRGIVPVGPEALNSVISNQLALAT